MGMLLGENEKNEEYKAFVDKFKPKLTTDDCYTPVNVYEAVRAWVFKRYELAEDTRVERPFWPGADYRTADYSGNCVVIDNPPFSILSEIERWYLRKNIHFFLFAPALTIFNRYDGLHYVLTDTKVTYENGAEVATSFVTNMGDYLVEVSSELYETVNKANKENILQRKKQLPRYELPEEVATSAKLRMLSKYGIDLQIEEKDALVISNLDSMREAGKKIYGRGLLLNKKAAAEKAAAEKAAAEKAGVIVWTLSERERKLTEKLGE